MIILEKKRIITYIRARKLEKEYLKAKNYLKKGNYKAVNLRKKIPKSEDIWYFRITKKYRALAEKKGNTLYVFKISDHQ